MNKIFTKAALAASVSLFAFNATALESADVQASVTVQNAFTFTNDAGLNFGTIRATADPAGTTTATIVMPANPGADPVATDGTNASIAELVRGERALFSVSGVAPFGTLTLDSSGITGNVNAVTAPPGTPKFTIGTPTFWLLTGGAGTGALFTTTLQVDATGAATFNMGATLTTDAAVTTSAYIDGEYRGTFALTLDY
ncbi:MULTISPECIES: hypothetical protein [Pseudoalteromonas]|jgi:hypothetical protein|uniref:DUF4402 domain-containing protein n=1 Tax=Pseudoalteromonas tetraodonis GFC TaxID=1315271 RepID=A0AA37S008_9GAMM|nr:MULTISPECIES: hypothetical protein [Pseudoalteromonas]MAY60254.1 hypothetical protein [Pseudoalteromonas sp.]ATD03928.1 hypothetical protein PTET_a2618 [Pseudoalteromonas tetraodonis]MDN3404587.1 hypothetical protein [Pseudoalteromonas sp. APC 3218]MDN3409911.1 hypothetical protein [Pseudoalteromonas sp. APC 3894]MDN3415060.1 hypothetical protein [Pseudoalteromonas sp. APC 3227]|tara:strand:- start:9385 stop:9978 length:594 start_codon:yes stop_codon:yes gene_type:complete